MSIKVVDIKGSAVSEEKIPEVFSKEVNDHLIWEVVVAEQANKRQGTHQVKTKGEVRGGGKKPWKQKGTGRARAGSNRSPIWKGGGTIFGPSPRDYTQHIPTKKKTAGIRNIFSKKIQDKKVIILDKWTMEKPSTSEAFIGINKILKASDFFKEYSEGRKLRKNTNDKHRSVALVYDTDEQASKLSVKNLPWVKSVHVDRLAALPLWHNHGIIITKDAFKKIQDKVKK